MTEPTTPTKPKTFSPGHRQFNERVIETMDWKMLNAVRKRQIEEECGEAAESWEGITSSGILVKGSSGVYPPASLGIPYSLGQLLKVFPHLEIRSRLD